MGEIALIAEQILANPFTSLVITAMRTCNVRSILLRHHTSSVSIIILTKECSSTESCCGISKNF